jgi:hypothetical protein
MFIKKQASITNNHPPRASWSRAQAWNGYHGPLLALTTPLDAGPSPNISTKG